MPARYLRTIQGGPERRYKMDETQQEQDFKGWMLNAIGWYAMSPVHLHHPRGRFTVTCIRQVDSSYLIDCEAYRKDAGYTGDFVYVPSKDVLAVGGWTHTFGTVNENVPTVLGHFFTGLPTIK